MPVGVECVIEVGSGGWWEELVVLADVQRLESGGGSWVLVARVGHEVPGFAFPPSEPAAWYGAWVWRQWPGHMGWLSGRSVQVWLRPVVVRLQQREMASLDEEFVGCQ